MKVIFIAFGILFMVLGIGALLAIVLMAYGFFSAEGVGLTWLIFVSSFLFGVFLYYQSCDEILVINLFKVIGIFFFLMGLWAGVSMLLNALQVVKIEQALDSSVLAIFIFLNISAVVAWRWAWGIACQLEC